MYCWILIGLVILFLIVFLVFLLFYNDLIKIFFFWVVFYFDLVMEMLFWWSFVVIVIWFFYDGGCIYFFYFFDGLRYGDFGLCVVFVVICYSIYMDYIVWMESIVYIKVFFIVVMWIGMESFIERIVDVYFYGGFFYLFDLVFVGEV